jgi:hypothetical protein
MRNRTTTRLALGCSFVAFALVPLAAGRLSAAQRLPPPPAVSPLAASVIAPLSRVRGTDKRRHLVYEIALLNTSATVQRMDRVEVLTGGGRVVASYTGPDAVKAIMSDDVNTLGSIDVLPPSGGGVLWLDVTFENGARIPGRLVHRFTTAPLAVDGAATAAATAMLGARTVVSSRAPVVVAPPLRGADFAITTGCCGISAHTRSLQTIDGKRYLAQRFATDWVQIDGQGRWWTGDPAVNESYPVFGSRVFAATSGVVVSTRNDLPENTPPHALANIDLSNALGNHVTVDMGGSRFATYAHMQPGSITVSVGEAVHRGQVLGRVGNTGSSAAPHLHFHITNSALLARSNGVPYEFTGFRLTGKILNLEAWLDQEVSVPADIGSVAPPARRRGQLPLTTDIVTFR